MKILTKHNFSTIAQFVLREGDRVTYCNTYNDNPHFAHAGFDVFLNPASPENVDCDPEQGGFDELTMRDEHKGSTVYTTARMKDGELDFDAKSRDALEYYFAALIAHISAQIG